MCLKKMYVNTNSCLSDLDSMLYLLLVIIILLVITLLLVWFEFIIPLLSIAINPKESNRPIE